MNNKTLIIFIFFLITIPFHTLASTKEKCIECHGKESKDSRFHISEEELKSSVHGNELICVDCHALVLQPGHEKVKGSGAVSCNECHDQENMHGLSGKQENRPQCHTCHGKHNILNSDDEASFIHQDQLQNTCEPCHPIQSQETGLLNGLVNFQIRSHKKQDFSNPYHKKNCIGCHQGQAAHGEEGPINKQGCDSCHVTQEGRRLIMGSIHFGTDSKSLWTERFIIKSDLFLIALAIVIMLIGFFRKWTVVRTGRRENRQRNWAGLIRYLVGHTKILKNKSHGIAHILIFWGVLLPVFIILLAQFNFHIRPIPAWVLSLLADILGFGLLAGTLFFLIKRLSSTDLRGPRKTLLPMVLLLIILITGFMAEGTRLSITDNSFAWASPFGSLVSTVLPDSPVLMQVMIRVHFLIVLLLIALLPFTFFRHLIAAPLNVLFKQNKPLGQLNLRLFNQGQIGVKAYTDFSWKQLLDVESCVSCGRCEENCPAFISGKPLSPRKVIQDILKQMEARSLSPLVDSRINMEEIWSCTTCMACLEHCPIFIEPMDKIMDMRTHQTLGKGVLPEEAGSLLRNLELFGDMDGKGIAHRTDWAFNQDVPHFHSNVTDPEVLLWVGCSGAFHPRYLEVTRAMVSILKRAGVSFSILGKEELCCGDPARRLGEESLFQELARKNIQWFKRYNVKKIIALCPHCFNTLKNEYPQIEEHLENKRMKDIQVIHAAEYVEELINKKQILLKYPVNKRITIQDPCYLGRGNRIYEPLREIIKAVPGTKLIELERHKKKSFCCGGGGGGMWLHENIGQRINAIRAQEVVVSDVDLLGTACPYCLTMLEDGIKSHEPTKPLKALDIIEIVAGAVL